MGLIVRTKNSKKRIIVRTKNQKWLVQIIVSKRIIVRTKNQHIELLYVQKVEN